MGELLDIAVMLLWIFTAAAGVSLLAARRPDRGSGNSAPAPAAEPEPARAGAGVPSAAAAAYAAGAKVPPITHTRITTRPGEHPLLEFMHPALGLVGLGGWMAFVITRFHVFAWVALGVIVVTIVAGLTWYAVSARAAQPAAAAGTAEGAKAAEGVKAAGTAEEAAPGTGPAAGRLPGRPAQRLLIHGSGAAVTFVLAIVTTLIAFHALPQAASPGPIRRFRVQLSDCLFVYCGAPPPGP